MQSIVHDIVKGACCVLCGSQFVRERKVHGADVPTLYEHGQAVACTECWTPDCGYDMAIVPTEKTF